MANPASALVIVLAASAIDAARALRDRFEHTVAELTPADGSLSAAPSHRSPIGRTILRFGLPGGDIDDRERLSTLVEPHGTGLAVVIAWALFGAWVLLNPPIQRIVLVDEGPVIGGIKYGLLIPWYLTLAAEFFVTYLGIIVFLPVKIQALGIIDFQDPLGFAGRRPVGDLIRRAST